MTRVIDVELTSIKIIYFTIRKSKIREEN